MSAIPIDRSQDLQRLRDAGYDIFVTDAGYLVLRDVPYINGSGELVRGSIASNLELAGDITVQPVDHTAKFIGDYPCTNIGVELAILRQASGNYALGSGLTAQHSFSRKPPRGHYIDYYEKMVTYVSLIQQSAVERDPNISAKTRKIVEPEIGESPFNYLDTASSRSDINGIASKICGLKIAIIGLGGTGSYILDAVAKTPVGQIHLFDVDQMLTHNAFRAPGAPSIEELRAHPLKVDYLKSIYSKMHRGIETHPVRVDASNVGLLEGMSFVFLSMDSGDEKRAVVNQLEIWGTPFIDVGMGLYVKRNKISGILRSVISLPDARDEARSRISFTRDDAINEYDKNIQIAELNSLNACLAVIAWKKHFGYYWNQGAERFISYTVGTGQLAKADIHEN